MPEQQEQHQPQEFTLAQVVSGGQTGVDRAALDAASQCNIPIGGWCPRGRRSEDGRIPDNYPLDETTARSYAVRTEWNVRDSDGTLIVVLSEISSGTRLTIDSARQQGRPHLVIALRPDTSESLFSDTISEDDQIQSVVDWITAHRIRVLNVAGPRGSAGPDVYALARRFLDRLFAAAKTPASR
jgi:hypothetical protein